MKKLAAIIVAGICLAAVSCHFLTPGGLSNLPEQLSHFAETGQLTDSTTNLEAKVVLPDAPKRPDNDQTVETETEAGDDSAQDIAEDAEQPAGNTQYFGRSETSDQNDRQVAAWAAEAEMNPDYTPPAVSEPAANGEVTVDESDETVAQEETVTQEAAPPKPGVTQFFGRSEGSSEKPAWATEATSNPDYKTVDVAAADTETAAEEAPATEPKSGVTQFFGRSEDTSEKLAWAAEAIANSDYVPAEPTATDEPSAETDTVKAGVTQFFGRSEKSGDTPAWAQGAARNPDYEEQKIAQAETPAASEVATPPEPGITQFFGRSEKSDDTPAWAQEASKNPDYTVEETIVVEAPKPKPEPDSAPEQKPGVTQFFGRKEGSGEQPAWATEAAENPNYSAAPPPAPETETEPASPVVSEKITTCRDKLNAEAQSGRLLFRSGSSMLTASSKKALDSLAAIAKECGNVTIEVAGHTDNTGAAAFNKKLSQARAERVAKYLISAGVKPSLVNATGYGASQPITSNDTSEGRAMNRRIEFNAVER